MIDKDIATKTISLNKALWQHPYTTWDADKVSVMTTEIEGRPLDDYEIKKDIARELDDIVGRISVYYYNRSLLMSRAIKEIEKPIKKEKSPDTGETDAELAELGLDSDYLELDRPEVRWERKPVNVTPNMVELIEITENSKIITSVFPRSFGCRYCGHFTIIDPDKNLDLECPCCKEQGMAYCKVCGSKVKVDGKKCVKCRNDTTPIQLYQESIVNVCPRCANIMELAPLIFRPSDTNSEGVYECPECSKTKKDRKRKRVGHLHLDLGQNIGDAKWQCTNRKECNYQENLTHYCSCGVYKVPEGEKKDISLMKPRPTAASNTSAIAKTYISIGDNIEFDISKLRTRNIQDMSENRDTSWRLDEIPERIREMIKQTYKIKDAYTVSDIRTIMAVYGYVSNVTVPGFDESKRLRKHFKQQGRLKYKAYVVKTKGNGLVIELDKEHIAKVIGQYDSNAAGRSYDEIIDEAIETMRLGEFQELIDNPDAQGLGIVSCLHAIEHSFLDTTVHQIGLDVFGSKIMLRDCAIIVFEREEIGEGGVYQLTLEDQFLRFMNNVRKKFDCLHDCDDACIACVYTYDFNCQPYLQKEIRRWFPPNSILNRHLGRKGLGG
jgi:hypothetical protein